MIDAGAGDDAMIVEYGRIFVAGVGSQSPIPVKVGADDLGHLFIAEIGEMPVMVPGNDQLVGAGTGRDRI